MPKTSTKRRRRIHPVVAAIVPAVVPRLVAAVVPPVVAAVVQPVAKRLARIEALLIEMRFEHDVQTKRINAIKAQLDVLTDKPLSKRQPAGSQTRPAQPAKGAGLAQ